MIKVIPSVLVQSFLNGGSVTGVAPVGAAYSFAVDGAVGAPFQYLEALSWGANTGVLIRSTVAVGAAEGDMVIAVTAGVPPVDGDTITGGVSLATADVNGAVKVLTVYDTEETVERGRYREFAGLVDGGLMDVPVSIAARGYRVINVLVNLPGVASVDLFIEDMYGQNQFASSIALVAGKGYTEFRNGGILVAPRCKFKIVGAGALTGNGQFMLVIGNGWSGTVFGDAPSLGASNLPPGMQ